MQRRTLGPALLALLALSPGLAGCSWSRFDDVQDGPPVVLLKKPSKMKAGFGVSLSVATVLGDEKSRVLVGGSPGKNPAAAFDLGIATSPQISATDLGSCDQAVECYLADRTAGLGTADIGAKKPENLCFVFGLGKADGAPEIGLLGRCASAYEYTLPVPANVLADFIKGDVIYQDMPAPLVLATDKGAAPALIAGARGSDTGLTFAWFYPPLSNSPKLLEAPGETDPTFGASVASVRLGDGGDGGVLRHVFAVGAPDAGHVWLFDDSGQAVGCLGGPKGFGRTLASGRVDGDDALDELVIADATNVSVISGASLAGLGPASDITCSLAVLPEGGLMASFSCGSRDSVTGCSSGFATSLDVGDLDGDGDGEIVVGAPDMKVRGTKNAGAVLVYDIDGNEPQLLSDQLFISSAESGDELGSSVATASIEGRDIVIAGAAGKGRTAVFYCSSLLGEGQGGTRCR